MTTNSVSLLGSLPQAALIGEVKLYRLVYTPCVQIIEKQRL